jgi:hypothetical protein
MVKESLQELLSPTFNRSEYRRTVEQHMFDYFKSNRSPAVKDACKDVILNEFNANVEGIKSKSDAFMSACSNLSWLVRVIQRCDTKLFETVVKEFCEDADLRNVIADLAPQIHRSACDVLTILIDQVLKAMGNGELITAMSFRVDFLTNWADTMVKLIVGSNNLLMSQRWVKLQTGIIDVADTLPLVEQKRIFIFWNGIFTKKGISTSSLFKWWAEKVHDAIIKVI